MKFPQKATYWAKMVGNSEYTKRLASVDIAIFNAARQNGLGNIYQLLYMGKKVYLNTKNSLYAFLRQKGFEVHDVQELKTVTYNEFIKPISTEYPNPWFKQTYNMENIKEIWKIIFLYVEGNIDYETAYEENLKLL